MWWSGLQQVLALKALAVEAMSHMARSSSKHRSRLGAKVRKPSSELDCLTPTLMSSCHAPCMS